MQLDSYTLRTMGIYAPDGTTGKRLDNGNVLIRKPNGQTREIRKNWFTNRWTTVKVYY
jgi:hypothetical protein